jgi:hypothetical protein
MGVFVKILSSKGFFGISELFFYWKSGELELRSGGLSPHDLAHRVYEVHWMAAVEITIDDRDFKDWRGIRSSNLDHPRWNKWWGLDHEGGGADRGARQRHRWPRWQKVPRCYGTSNLMRFSRMASWRWEDLGYAHLDRRRAAARAGYGSVLWSKLSNDEGALQCTSDLTNMMENLLDTSSCFPRHRIGLSGSGISRAKATRVRLVLRLAGENPS